MKIFDFLKSLKLAILLLISLSFALIFATLIESKTDARVAAYFVYDAFWFSVVLYLLALNIFFVALSRFPWKKKHCSFLLAHLGILLLLIGSWVTKRFGVDADLRVEEGRQVNRVALHQHFLWVQKEERLFSREIPYLPSFIPFSPFFFSEAGIWVRQYLTHATAHIQFKPLSYAPDRQALHLKVLGGPMQLNEDFWLWQGAADWSAFHAGPAFFELGKQSLPKKNQVQLSLKFTPQGDLEVLSWSSDQKKVHSFVKSQDLIGAVLSTNWKAGVKVMVVNAYVSAMPFFQFTASKKAFGSDAESAAIEVALEKEGEGVWLSLGSRMQLPLPHERFMELGFVPKEVLLPFSLFLHRFEIDFNPGTKNPGAYRSYVQIKRVSDQFDSVIQMNEPLNVDGYTIYQASYEADLEVSERKPFFSIFSVNKDPGRLLKYLGSFFIVLGTIFLFNRNRKGI